MPAKIRPKFDKCNWNGMSNTFRAFRNTVEGHLYQTGAAYMTNQPFLDIYKRLGEECFKSDVIWQMFRVNEDQAISDKEFLFGILTSCTTNIQHKILLKYAYSRDGILALDEFKKEFEYNGFKELKHKSNNHTRVQILEAWLHTLTSSSPSWHSWKSFHLLNILT